jgi:hypothetical protein
LAEHVNAVRRIVFAICLRKQTYRRAALRKRLLQMRQDMPD